MVIPEPMGSFHSPSHRDAVITASGWTTVFAVVFWICLVSVTQFPEFSRGIGDCFADVEKEVVVGASVRSVSRRFHEVLLKY